MYMYIDTEVEKNLYDSDFAPRSTLGIEKF